MIWLKNALFALYLLVDFYFSLLVLSFTTVAIKVNKGEIGLVLQFQFHCDSLYISSLLITFDLRASCFDTPYFSSI